MKPKDISESEETYKKETGFVYHPGSISRLDREPSPEEIWEDMAEGRKKKFCVRCWINSNGRQKNGVEGLTHCKVCGGPVWV